MEEIKDRSAEGEVQLASPRAQALTLGLLVVLAALGFWVILDIKAQVREAMLLSQKISPRIGAEHLLTAGRGFFRMLGLWIAGAGLYLGLLGSRIWRHERFPAPGFGVVRDTRVVHGRAAKRRATWTLAIAALLLVAAVALPTVGGAQLREALAEPLASSPNPPVIDLDAPYVPRRAPEEGAAASDS